MPNYSNFDHETDAQLQVRFDTKAVLIQAELQVLHMGSVVTVEYDREEHNFTATIDDDEAIVSAQYSIKQAVQEVQALLF